MPIDSSVSYKAGGYRLFVSFSQAIQGSHTPKSLRLFGGPVPRQAICFTFLVKIIDCLKPLKPYALLPFIGGVFFLSAIWGENTTFLLELSLANLQLLWQNCKAFLKRLVFKSTG